MGPTLHESPSLSLEPARPAAPRVVAPRQDNAPMGTIAICGGGTAGHVMTGLAIAEELRRRSPEQRVVFLGGRHGLESSLVPGGPCQFVTLPCSPVARAGLGGLRGVVNSVAGAIPARRILREYGVELVIGVGGYASVPGVLAGWSMGLPVTIVEVNAQPGLANRVLAPLVHRVFLGELSDRRPYAPEAIRTTGVPLRQSFTRGLHTARRPLRTQPRVLVTGGSLGSAFLNQRVPELLARVRSAGVAFSVKHQAGAEDALDVRRAYREAGVQAEVVDFVDDFAGQLSRVDFVVGSPGAVTIAELSAAGIPCLLVPDPRAAADHQSDNARVFADRTGSLTCRPAEWDATWLATEISARLADPVRLARDAARVAAHGTPRAVERLVDECLLLAAGRS